VSFRNGIRRMAAVAVAVVVASAGVVTGTAGSAAAASVVPVGYVKLCNGSNYTASLGFPERAAVGTVAIRPGTCVLSGTMSGLNRAERVEFQGKWLRHDGWFLLYATTINLSTKGLGVTAEGTTDGYWFTTW